MNAERSVGVETTAPDAQAPLGLRKRVTSLGSAFGLTRYPWMYGAGSEIRRVGKLVWVRLAGPNTMSLSRAGYGVPETVSAMSPTTMLSVLEYSYFEPGVNSSGDLRTQSMISVGAT